MVQCASCGGDLSGSPRFCPACGSPVDLVKSSQDSPAKETVRPTKSFKGGAIAFLLIAGVGLGIYFSVINPSENDVIKKQPVVEQPFDYDSNFVEMVDILVREDGDDLVIPLSTVKDAKLVRFKYSGGKTDRYVMAYIAPNGKLVTAMSISDHCGSTEFKIKDNQIYCARCPSHWDMLTMEAYACCSQYFPDPIPSRVDLAKNEVRVKKEVINKWAGRL